MDNSINPETFASLFSHWRDPRGRLLWNCLFVLPGWLQTWWNTFGSESSLNLFSLKKDGELLGIAPLRLDGQAASFIGSADICDCLDFIVVPGREDDFFRRLLDALNSQGVASLDLRCLRPDSTVTGYLENLARLQGCQVSVEPDGITMEMELPPTWDEYLLNLSSKQRHETRRKLRRLYESGDVSLRLLQDPGPIRENMDVFFSLFRQSRADKTEFMTEQMEAYFIALAQVMAEDGVLNLTFLDFNRQPAAVTMSFDFLNTTHLYNNGYNPELNHLSLGVTSKALSIRDSIEQGRTRYDFLKGTEEYKYRLGGREVRLSRCVIEL